MGVANVASAVSQGFAVSGADLRTAMSDAAGGKTHAVGLVAAAAVALVLLFLTAPLQYVPMAALGAVLVVAGLSLIDIRSVSLFYQIDRTEAVLSALATLGVLAVGAVNGILFAVVLALLRVIKLMSRPRVEILGKIEGLPGLHSLERHEGGQQIPGLLLFRFNAPITFFNAPYFKRELIRVVDEAGPNLRHVVIDLLPVTNIDATGLLTVTELVGILETRGVRLNAAGRATEWRTGPGHGALRETESEFFPPCAKPFVTCRSGVIRSDCLCPLLAQSRHAQCADEFGGKADIDQPLLTKLDL